MRNMSSKVGDIDQIRAERDARNNPPSFEAGQGGDDDWGDLFGDDSSTDSNSFGGSDFNSGSGDFGSFGGGSFGGGSFGGGSFGGGSFGGNIQGQPQQNTVNTDLEDKFFDAVIKGSKGLFSFFKVIVLGLVDGLKSTDCFEMSFYAGKVLVTSASVSGVSFVFWLLSMFSKRLSRFKWVMVGGLISLSLGFVLFGFSLDASRKKRNSLDDSCDTFEDRTFSSNDDYGNNDDYSNDYNGSTDFGFDDEDSSSGWGGFSDEEDGDDNDSFSDDIWGSIGSFDDVVEETSSTSDSGSIDIDYAISSIRDIPAHTQTRQYLYEEYSRVLPKINPTFARLNPISEDDPNFLSFDQILRDAAIQVGTKEDKIPMLLELRENQFIIQLKATRPSGLKEEEIANEIANIYSKDDFGAVECEGVYATTSSVGGNYIINIFKGENSLVSLADTYKEVSDFILDTNNKKPIVFGVNELGRVWTIDAEKVFSYIISGKPRSGKSWSVVALVLQLCMYSSPKEVTFEAFDVKDTSSDYFMMADYLPHFKGFVSDGNKILNRLRYLTSKEADRRKKILEKEGVISIADLKKKNPNIELPYLYVIIDEIVGLVGKFSKEEHAEFKDLVNILITQMPNLGVRLILVPHRVTNDIVPKTTYTNVGCIACVRSDMKEIMTTLDITKKDFPYDLANTGDMALKSGEINKGKTVFCHGIAITTSNEANLDIYKFVGHLWNKLEPDTSNNFKEYKIARTENYKGHTLVGVDDIDDDEIDESFWDSL